MKPEDQHLGIFTAPHGIAFAENGDLYVQDWNVSRPGDEAAEEIAHDTHAPMIVRHLIIALAASAWAAGGEWEPLCNGRDLGGWKLECREPDRNKAFWKVRDGAIECDTAGDRKHDYMWLVSEREFGDFEFECLVRSFSNSSGNSGIQIRSRFLNDPNYGPWMHGPQVDIHPPTPWRSGLDLRRDPGNAALDFPIRSPVPKSSRKTVLPSGVGFMRTAA